jgi:S-DNA-T family DNA segregation ATPase FtsK/SpoIIIE
MDTAHDETPRTEEAAAEDAGAVTRAIKATRPTTRSKATGKGGGRRKSSDSGRKDPPPGRRREILGLLLVSTVVAMVLALASYDPADASFNSAGSGTGGVQNLIGPAGAYVADLLFQALGLLAYVLAAALLLWAARFLIGMPRPRLRFGTWLGIVLLPPTTAILLHLALSSRRLLPYPPAGAFGKILAERLRGLFHSTGSYIITVTVLLLAIALLTRISYGRVLERVTEWFGVLFQHGMVFGRRGASYLRSTSGSFAEGVRNVGGDLSEWATEKAAAAATRAPAIVVPGDPDVDAAPATATREDDHDDGDDGDASDAEHAPARGHAEEDDAGDEADETAAPAPDEPTPATTAAPPARALGLPAPRPATQPSLPKIDAEPAIVVPRAHDAETPDFEDEVPRRGPIRMPAAIATPEHAPAGGPAYQLLNPDGYQLASLSLLDYQAQEEPELDRAVLIENARMLERKLKDYGVDGNVVEIRPGPVVTMYEFLPGPGIKVSKIAGLADDLAMGLAALSVRIVAPIPGKGVVGIEVPNKKRQTVYLKEIIGSKSFRGSESMLELALGKDIEGFPVTANLAKMPHLLVAGATGAGKSVALNSMITSILFKASPDDVRFLMVDPKRLELSIYEGIPHLLLPVVYDPKQAALALQWAVKEMERRYALLQDMTVREIHSYNRKVARLLDEDQAGAHGAHDPDEDDYRPREKLPHIVIVIDELADLMMVASRDVEASIQRLAQMARAAGIHLILATQRPSTDVITGTIKANFPSRISFQVSTKTDSRTILDQNGAETLLGMGDMLFMRPGVGSLQRVHGAFVSDEEIKRVVDFIKSQGRPVYDASILKASEEDGERAQASETEYDEKWNEAITLVAQTRQASISMLQRRLKVGYNRAARMIEQMEIEGIVGPSDVAGKPREVLIPPA